MLTASSSSSGEKINPDEAVEELKYRCALKTALDSLEENAPTREEPPSKAGPSTRSSRANGARSLSSSPLSSCQPLSKEDLESESLNRKRKQRNSPNLRTGTKKQNLRCSFIPEESPGANENGTKLSKRSTGELCNTSNSDSENCTAPGLLPLSREQKTKPRWLKKSLTSNKASLKLKEEKCKQGRRARGAGSPGSLPNGSSKGRGQPPAEGTSVSASCSSGTALPGRSRVSTRQQHRAQMLLRSSSKNASVSQRSTGSENRNRAKQVNERKKARSLKQAKGKQEAEAGTSSSRKKECRNSPEPSAGLSDCRVLSDGVLSRLQEEEDEDEPPEVMDRAKEFHLPDFEEEEGGHTALRVCSLHSF